MDYLILFPLVGTVLTYLAARFWPLSREDRIHGARQFLWFGFVFLTVIYWLAYAAWVVFG